MPFSLHPGNHSNFPGAEIGCFGLRNCFLGWRVKIQALESLKFYRLHFALTPERISSFRKICFGKDSNFPGPGTCTALDWGMFFSGFAFSVPSAGTSQPQFLSLVPIEAQTETRGPATTTGPCAEPKQMEVQRDGQKMVPGMLNRRVSMQHYNTSRFFGVTRAYHHSKIQD